MCLCVWGFWVCEWCRCLCLNLNFLRPYFMRLPMRTFKILYYIFCFFGIFPFEFFHFFARFCFVVVHNFWAVEALNFAFFWLLAVLEADTTPTPGSATAPSPAPLLVGAAAAVHDLVFNGVCFEAGFPFCGKGFMTAFYGHFQIQTHTERDTHTHIHISLYSDIIYLKFGLLYDSFCHIFGLQHVAYA